MNKKILISFAGEYVLKLPPGHKFPMQKYKLIPEILLKEKSIKKENLFSPVPAEREAVELTHSKEYVDKLLNLELTDRELRRIGFPRSKELIEREFIIAQGTIDAALSSLKTGVGLNVAGGTHHAYRDRGEGFCLLNDVAVAANCLLREKLVKRVLIADLDVHQGNGTAKIFDGNKNVFTFSMHGVSNFPLKKEVSDLDIPLQDNTGDSEYLEILIKVLPELFSKFKPDFLFYISGVDVLATDKWGRLALSIAGAKQRDEFVLSSAKNAGIPVAVSMGGGYSPHIEDIVQAHCNTFRTAFDLFG